MIPVAATENLIPVEEQVEATPTKSTHITLVTHDNMWYWWELLRSGLANMEHHFVDNDNPIMELAHGLYTARLYAYIASEITDGDFEHPNPMAMVVVAPVADVGTNGKVLLIYALYAFQRPIPRAVLDRGRDHIMAMAKTFHCKKIKAEVQDKDMLRYCRALGWFTKEQTQLIAEVE